VNDEELNKAIATLADDLAALQRAKMVLARMNGASAASAETYPIKEPGVEWRPLAMAFMQDGHYHGPKEVLTHLEKAYGLRMNYGTVSSWMIRSRDMQKHPRKRGQFKLAPTEEQPKTES